MEVSRGFGNYKCLQCRVVPSDRLLYWSLSLYVFPTACARDILSFRPWLPLQLIHVTGCLACFSFLSFVLSPVYGGEFLFARCSLVHARQSTYATVPPLSQSRVNSVESIFQLNQFSPLKLTIYIECISIARATDELVWLSTRCSRQLPVEYTPIRIRSLYLENASCLVYLSDCKLPVR